ncbi:hypothetical protein MTo_02429 [Microcystis aeruginosa NIES-1211]|jgi:hypothetical protein|uniref:Uncharacterized protein n=1 Tax=Microcystis aeruginosa NIES-2519 TaxID=2303981 RepID=A0A5A5R747_MICAE|nr:MULTISPECIES: hypothetical protein [Microcystis]AVQ70399.1 hypothetical protein B5D77_02760 [Microcystis sp. MC19]GBL15119.1 hypothetical protein MTo_02429 [Microcystis aeruginosa NIES-1211]GCA70675.1 hypothetical protein MiYa_02210 [Microcystis aeruginosa NIES-2519]GCA83493.1 hypothetical protein MiHa_01458 [Microcystis aeruginosa NIES-2522]GCA87633.1 hypothetical protein MiTa_00968 [Microcystis aeruginosa NIES-4264]
MSDHQASYAVNAMLGRLYLKNKAFQSLSFEEQQSIVLDIIKESYLCDVNIGEILSNECFSDFDDVDEQRTIATIFQICSYCGQASANVQDYGDYFSKAGICSDCLAKHFPDS